MENQNEKAAAVTAAQNTESKVSETVVDLCEWIQWVTNDCAGVEELKMLPEVIRATAELYKSLYN
ncbi:hypothetical protein WMW72_35200 [Paenibacillus filicis]|uniref:Uncharacterized protein n=1 Tax=Paenibacillus filicis TaxID=669464 RepID=A0ABU9DWN6_9BACL